MLDNTQSEALVRTLGARYRLSDARHGVTIVAHGIHAPVFVSIYTMLNAKMLSEARGSQREIVYLNEGEVALTLERLLGPLVQNRAWEYWARHVEFSTE